jgi:hypothetical protein
VDGEPQNIPNGHKKYQHLRLQDPPKFTQIGIFGLKIEYHLPRVSFHPGVVVELGSIRRITFGQIR